MGLELLRSGSVKMFGLEREVIRTDPLEVVVEETIEDGVGADGGDANEVEDHEEGHHVLGVVEQVRHLCHQAEQAARVSSKGHKKQLRENGFYKYHLYFFRSKKARETLKQR